MPVAIVEVGGRARGSFNTEIGTVTSDAAVGFGVRVPSSAITGTRYDADRITDLYRRGYAVSSVDARQIVVGPRTRIVHEFRQGAIVAGGVAVENAGARLALVVQAGTKERLRHDVQPALGQARHAGVEIIEGTAHHRARSPRVLAVRQRDEVHRCAFATIFSLEEIVAHLGVAVDRATQNKLIARRDIGLMEEAETVTVVVYVRHPVSVAPPVGRVLVPSVV